MKTMNCESIHKKLIFFIEGDLPDNEMQVISKHLSQCPECSRYAEDFRRTFEVIDEEKRYEVSPYFYSKLKVKLEKQMKPIPETTLFSIWERFLQPALFSVLLLAGIYTGIITGRDAVKSTAYNIESPVEALPFLNEMDLEPLESFLIE